MRVCEGPSNSLHLLSARALMANSGTAYLSAVKRPGLFSRYRKAFFKAAAARPKPMQGCIGPLIAQAQENAQAEPPLRFR